ncbi:hypothetical protein LCGC14_1954380 [marine sediment metagenome]|uniref:Sulfatase N-terminal domain-containing protein n=1 Tax=marine sediment metagenome TaxID=412755 RepID=A0A0F9FGS4_9ZZZZ
MNPPNILWICSDQQRFDTLGCYGNSFVATPNLDALAAGGVLFERAYCQNPVCTPSRASFLTGRYPHTTRARQNGQCIPADEVLVTRILAEAGYTCGLSGKLHLSACNPSACKTAERRIDDGYSEFHWSHHPNPDWPANEYCQWLAEQGAAFETTQRQDCRYVRNGMPAEHHQTTWCAQKAVDFIRARDQADGPWLFSVNMFDPHHALDPPESYLRRYLEILDEVPLPNFVPGELDNKFPWQQRRYEGDAKWHGPTYSDMAERDHRLCRAAYWAMCDLIDEQVGRMLAALDETAQRDNTLVIYMSDHGEMLGDHGIYLKGAYLYDPAIHVPLIMSFPGVVEPHRRSDALVELVDLPQTLLDSAGLEHHPGMQGRSLWPLLTGQTDLDRHRDDVYCEYYTGGAANVDKHSSFLTMVATRMHRLISAVGHGGELYDLVADPTETHNLWDSPEHLAIKAELLKRLTDRMALTADPLPAPLSPW